MITSMSNARIKQVTQLMQRAKVRNERDLFVIEGVKLFEEAPKERIREVYLSESFYEKWEDKALLQGHAYEIVSDDVFQKMTDTVHPQGILCTVAQFHDTLEDMMQGANPLLLIGENLQDPGNLGTLIRTGEGAGVDGVILTRESVDLYNPKVIRSTMGSIFRMKTIYIEDIVQVLGQLQEAGVRVYAAHLSGMTYYTDTNFQGPTAFLIGNEARGLEECTAQQANDYVKIPMSGQVESLNAAMAAGLLVYEARRQREG